MAPEHILGVQLDGRADLHALGCCAWWLLTGREVFARAAAEANLLHKHIYEPLPSLASRMATWRPPELDVVIVACLAKDVADRPTDARALADRLRAIRSPRRSRGPPAVATARWQSYQPAQPVTAVSSSEVQVVMPGATISARSPRPRSPRSRRPSGRRPRGASPRQVRRRRSYVLLGR